MVALPLRGHVKRGGFLAVEGAKTLILPPHPPKHHVIPHQLHDVKPLLDLPDDIHIHGGSSLLSSLLGHPS
jgi:hypothetical protein